MLVLITREWVVGTLEPMATTSEQERVYMGELPKGICLYCGEVHEECRCNFHALDGSGCTCETEYAETSRFYQEHGCCEHCFYVG